MIETAGWVNGFRDNTFRGLGPRSMAAAGYPQFFTSLADKNMYLMTLPVSHLAEGGVSMLALKAHLDNSRGAQAFQAAQHVVIPPKGMVWIPGGLFPMLFSDEPDPEKTGIAFGWSLPLLSIKMVKAMDAESREAVQACYFKTCNTLAAESKAWASSLDELNVFLQASKSSQ